jgi:hypothetical protein
MGWYHRSRIAVRSKKQIEVGGQAVTVLAGKLLLPG